jgi:hypothetical protein
MESQIRDRIHHRDTEHTEKGLRFVSSLSILAAG